METRVQGTPPNCSQTYQNWALKLDFCWLCVVQSTRIGKLGISLIRVITMLRTLQHAMAIGLQDCLLISGPWTIFGWCTPGTLDSCWTVDNGDANGGYM